MSQSSLNNETLTKKQKAGQNQKAIGRLGDKFTNSKGDMALMGSGGKTRKSNRNSSGLKGEPY